MADTIPEVIVPTSLADYLEVIARAVFQAGVAWRQIAAQWDAYQQAFSNFDPVQVAAFDDLDVERVLQTPGILRAARKVRAVSANAATLLALEREYGQFINYLRAFASYEELAADFRRRFVLVGAMSVWYVLFRTGFAVPRFETWVASIPGDHPRMREMVELARSQGRSPERLG
jgi:hypothetical protein